MLSRLRIVTLVRLQLGVLAVLLLVTAGLSLVEAWQLRSEVQRVERIDAAVDSLLTATENLAIERGTTNTALRGDAPVSAQVRGQIDARRGTADPALAQAFSILGELTLPDAAPRIAALRERLDALQALRAQADRAMALPRADRPTASVDGWMPTVIAAMESVADLSTALGQEVKQIDPMVAEQVQVKQLAWAIRDSAGRERATIGGALASGTGLSEAQRAAIANLRGRVDFGWMQIREAADRPGADSRLASQVAATQQAYFDVFRGRSDAVIAAFGEGQTAPMTGPAWYDLSNPALATLMAVKDASVEATAAITADQQAQASAAIVLQLTLLGLAAAVLLGAVLATQRRLARPVGTLTAAIEALVRREYDTPVPLRHQTDELGVIARALDVLREEGLRAQQLTVEREAEQAAALERSQRIEALARSFEQRVGEALGRSVQVADRVQTGAGGLSDAARRADDQARSVGSASDRASANVQTVAAASEELAASIQEINQQIEQSRTISDEAVAKARSTSGTVAGLSEAAARIDAVIALITGIAEQTNLLALNATIEAARAGEAGKGFAVVASEVKHLANQTSKATEEIAAQIHAMQGSTGEVVSAVDGIGSTITRLSEFVATIAAAAEEQGAATQEIARNVQEASAGTQQVNDGIAEVRAVSEATSGLAGEMLTLADELGTQARSLREEIDGFVAAVRAA